MPYSSILYQIFAFVRKKKIDRGRRCVIQYYVWSRNCVQLTVLSLFILQEKCVHSEAVCCQWYQLEGELYGNDGSREGCFQVHCIRLLSRFFQSISLSSQKSRALMQVHTHTHTQKRFPQKCHIFYYQQALDRDKSSQGVFKEAKH